VGFELTRPLFLGAGILALGIIVGIWRVFRRRCHWGAPGFRLACAS